jgi:hypothetical protein
MSLLLAPTVKIYYQGLFVDVLFCFCFQHWVDNANLKELISLDVDASDNLTEEALFNFINVYGPQLKGK